MTALDPNFHHRDSREMTNSPILQKRLREAATIEASWGNLSRQHLLDWAASRIDELEGDPQAEIDRQKAGCRNALD